jgi:hypothetical protein
MSGDTSSKSNTDDVAEELTGAVRRVELEGADEGEGTEEAGNGLARLVLTLVQLLHDLLEKQAIRRMEAGTLSDEEVERIGMTLKRQAETIEELCDAFNLDTSDLDLPLGTIQVMDEE